MIARPAYISRAQLALGLVVVVLLGGSLVRRLILPHLVGERGPAGRSGRPELGFERLGKTAARLDLPSLQRLARAEDVVAFDPYYQRRKHFRALPIEPLLVAAFGEAVPALRQRDFVMRARDGYAVPLSGSRLLEGGAYLAFADAEVPGWEPIGPERADPGPFYLIWARPEQVDLARHPRPWQLASIDIVDGSEPFRHAMPRDVAADSKAARGGLLFRARCISCHAINRAGGRVGPDLNVPQSILEYRPRQQVRAYIRDPRTFRYSNMPAHLDLTEAQLDEILGYFEVMSQQKYDPEASGDGAPKGPR